MTTSISELLSGALTGDLSAAVSVLLLVLKATCLLLAALCASLALQRASAGSRHLVWLVALAALLALPGLATWIPLPMPVLPEAVALSAAPTPTDPATATTSPISIGQTAVESREPRASASPSSFASGTSLTWGTGLLGIWAIVGLALVARLIYGAVSVHRIVRRARPLEHPDWQTPLYEIADRLGIDNAPRLLRSEDVKMPFASGLLASTIVLPAESDDWSAERRSAVLIHELGHVRRRDLIGHTLGRIACALYWFHPLVWTAARRLRIESERACDDLALIFGARPSDYAEHLLDIVTCVRDHQTPSVALAMAHRKEFEGRMLAILNPELRRRGPGRLQTASLVGTLALLALVVSAASPVARASEPQQRAAPLPAASGAVTFADTALNVAAQPRPKPVAAPQQAAAPVTAGAPAATDPDSADERWAILAKTLRTDSDASVRRVAAWGLQRYARTDGASEALVAALSSDADASVREMAAWALSHGRGAAVTAALLKALKDSDPKVQATSIWALGSIGDASAVEGLLPALSNTDAAVREIAAWAIGSSRPRQAPTALVNALSDKNGDVRRSVTWALYTIRDPSTVSALDAAIRRETDPSLQKEGIKALATMGDPAIDVLQRLVTSPDAEIRTVVVMALAGRGSGPFVWPWPRPEPRPFP